MKAGLRILMIVLIGALFSVVQLVSAEVVEQAATTVETTEVKIDITPDVVVDAPAVAVPDIAADSKALENKPENKRFVQKSGASTNALQETRITSARIEFDYKEFVAVFDENVRVENPQFFIAADRVVVFMEGTNQLRQIMALGNVTLTNEQRNAACDKAVYTRQSGQIVMTGSATLQRGGDFVRGDKIVIWLDDERMEVSPGLFVLSPETLKTRSKESNTNATPTKF